MDTFSAMQIVMMTMQGLTMLAALLFASFSAMEVPERPAPPEKERWELNAEKVKARLDDPENVKEEFGKFMTTRVGGRLYALEEKVKDFADSTVISTKRLRVLMIVQVGVGFVLMFVQVIRMLTD